MKKILLAGAACAALAVAPAMAAGLRTSNSFTVSLNVQPSCQAIQSIPDVVFPANLSQPGYADQPISVFVQCTGPYNVDFVSVNGAGANRSMKDPTGGSNFTIPYQITGCTLPNNQGGCTTFGAIGDSAGPFAPGSQNQPNQQFTVKITTNSVIPGTVLYSDSVTMEVRF
jgi:hypothetical protein